MEALLESPTPAQNSAVPHKAWSCTALATEAPVRFPKADTPARGARGQEVGMRALLSIPTLPGERRWTLFFDGPQLTDVSSEPMCRYSKYIHPVSRVISNNTGNLLCTRQEPKPLIYCSIYL